MRCTDCRIRYRRTLEIQRGLRRQETVKEQEEEKLTWLRQILEWQQDMADNHEFMNLLKSDLDLFADNVYCFSPAGDVKTLPVGSCAIDFAYLSTVRSATRWSERGSTENSCRSSTELHNGDRVEIITSQNSSDRAATG